MNGELAQVLALVAHGNAFLHGRQTGFLGGSVFQYVASVQFRGRRLMGFLPATVANSVDDWYDYLRSRRVSRLWLVHSGETPPGLPAHIAAAFSGGMQAQIQADHPRGHELWRPTWSLVGSGAKTWHVAYMLTASPTSPTPAAPDISSARARLTEAISRALELTRRPSSPAVDWAQRFSDALQELQASDPRPRYFPDLLPVSGYGLPARQVIAAASEAYVFGGMGSWNDLGFQDQSDQRQYDEITAELFAAVNGALAAAVNSFS